MLNRTTVIVAHRLSTVRGANMIVVIHKGKMVEKGSHFELLEDAEGAYSQLIQLQELTNDSEHQGSDKYMSEITMELSTKPSGQILCQHSYEVPKSTALQDPESCPPLQTIKKLQNIPLPRLAYFSKSLRYQS